MTCRSLIYTRCLGERVVASPAAELVALLRLCPQGWIELMDADCSEPLWVRSLDVFAVEEVPDLDEEPIGEHAYRSSFAVGSESCCCERRWHR